MDILELKKKYNYWLGRYLKAEQWISKSSEEEISKYINVFYEVIRELSLLMEQFKELTGREMTKEEIFKGFN